MTTETQTLKPLQTPEKSRPTARSELLVTLANLPRNLEAQLVIEALENGRSNSLEQSASGNKLQQLKTANNIGEPLFLEVLKEFRVSLDQKQSVPASKKPQTHRQRSKHPQSHQNTAKSTLQKPQAHHPEFCLTGPSLDNENPAVSAVILSSLPTNTAVEFLRSMQATQAQKSALVLAHIEAVPMTVPMSCRRIIREISQ